MQEVDQQLPGSLGLLPSRTLLVDAEGHTYPKGVEIRNLLKVPRWQYSGADGDWGPGRSYSVYMMCCGGQHQGILLSAKFMETSPPMCCLQVLQAGHTSINSA